MRSVPLPCILHRSSHISLGTGLRRGTLGAHLNAAVNKVGPEECGWKGRGERGKHIRCPLLCTCPEFGIVVRLITCTIVCLLAGCGICWILSLSLLMIFLYLLLTSYHSDRLFNQRTGISLKGQSQRNCYCIS